MRMRHRLRSAEVSHKILIRVTSDKHEKEKNRIIKSSILMKKIIRSEEHLTFSFCRETWLKLTHDTQTKYRVSLIAQWIEKQKDNTVCVRFDHLKLIMLLELQASVHNFSLNQMYQVKRNYYFHQLLT